jgi:uncharacterized protein (DUF1330 family)
MFSKGTRELDAVKQFQAFSTRRSQNSCRDERGWRYGSIHRGDLEIKDSAALQEYGRNVEPIIRKHGGEYLAVSDAPMVLEGNWRPHRIVLVRFPDFRSLQAFINDPEYAPWKALRLRVTRGSMIAFEGLPL